MAYGPLALLPEQFWALTYRQFWLLVDGCKERGERQKKRDAWLLANLLQPYSKEQLRPGMFLGEDTHTGWKQITPEEYEQILARKKRIA